MNKNLRAFIYELPGLNSYCDCKLLCSKLTIDHVLPKQILKNKLDLENYYIANNDPHNLYRCCEFININKKNTVICANSNLQIDLKFTGMLARSCLYMNDRYKLNMNTLEWNNLSLFSPPFDFEYERNKLIFLKTGKSNPFITKFN